MVMLSDSTEYSLVPFKLCLSVWSLILSHCPIREVDEVKRLLGTSLIEQVCDLGDEVSTLLEIWRLAKEDVNISLLREPSHHQPRFPEPPEMRQRLVKEIVFFVNYLKQKSTERRQSTSSILIDQNKNKHILQYVRESNESHPSVRDVNDRGSCESVESGSCVSVESGSCVSVESGRWSSGSRPRSALSSQDGRETPLRLLTPVTVDSNVLASLGDNLGTALNSIEIDSVISYLRKALKKECEQHHRDIEFLQGCIHGDSHNQDDSASSVCSNERLSTEPTLQELRDFSTQLEHAVLGETTLPPNSSLQTNHHLQSRRLPPLPPLPDRTPRPPPKPSPFSPSHQTITRASQVRRENSKQTNNVKKTQL